MSGGLDPVLVAALAGGLAALAVGEAVASSPGLVRWLRAALEPLLRAGREGYAPTAAERRRLAALGSAGLLGGAVLVAGPGLAPLLAPAGPALAGWAVARRRSRYRRAVDRGLPRIATAIADALASGRSVRAALVAASESLDGPPAIEMARLRAELELGAPTREALASLAERVGGRRVESFATAVLSQQLGGGDLSALLRRFAAATAERDRIEAEARSATAQARFTGVLVVAMPAGAALLAELLEPGFAAGMLADPAAAALIAAAAAMQICGFVAIRRLSRVTE